MDFTKKKEINVDNFPSGNDEEKFLVNLLNQIAGKLKQKYNYSDEDVMKLWSKENVLLVPITIFSGKLSPAEALSKFLKENHELTFHEISELIGRDERSVWANYKRAAKKMPWAFEIKEGISVNASIFKSEKSILESLVSYLKEVKKLRNKKIAQLLNKNSANIWTVYNRSKKKNESK